MEPLRRIIGRERGLPEVYRALKDAVRTLHPSLVGAYQVNCSDETEREGIECFQKYFVDDLLPELKFWVRSPFRVRNLGARHEWGAVAIAESHFATPQSEDRFKVLFVKVDAHVAVLDDSDGRHYGLLDRYHLASRCCGALHALLEDQDLPCVNDLREAFLRDGTDRLAMLLDPSVVFPQTRPLVTALVSAVLQSRCVVDEIEHHAPLTPTMYVVVPSVTLNKPGDDTEIICGFWTADRRSGDPMVEYTGLGDDPSRLRVRHETAGVRVDQPDLDPSEH